MKASRKTLTENGNEEGSRLSILITRKCVEGNVAT